jgi:hypothetical protein
MRLNRGTLVLMVVSIVVIVAVLVLSNQPGGLTVNTSTPTATAESAGPIFPDISTTDTQSKIVRFEIVNTTDNSKVVMTKDAASVWTVSEATNPQQLATDQTKAVGMMSNLASLNAISKFEAAKLADYGLEKPKYTMTLTDSDGKTYTVKVGDKSASSPRYYVLVNDDTKNVYLVQTSTVDMLIANIAIPAYVASPTPTATFTATPNPYSEVEQTATAVIQQQQFAITLTAMAEGTSEVTAEATGEATTEATSEVTPEATGEATTEATSEVTPEATAQIAPSATPAPTSTPVPPSATPTVTPTVTVTPTTGS